MGWGGFWNADIASFNTKLHISIYYSWGNNENRELFIELHTTILNKELNITPAILNQSCL